MELWGKAEASRTRGASKEGDASRAVVSRGTTESPTVVLGASWEDWTKECLAGDDEENRDFTFRLMVVLTRLPILARLVAHFCNVAFMVEVGKTRSAR